MTTHIENRLALHSVNDQTPYEIMSHKLLDFSNFHPFGKAEVLHEHKKPNKLSPRTFECIYLDPNPSGAGYRFYNQATKHFLYSHNATFYDNVFPAKLSRGPPTHS